MKRLDIRISDEDKAVLDAYCKQKEITQSDAVRTWIRVIKRLSSLLEENNCFKAVRS